MAVVATSFLASIEGDCGRSVLSRAAAVGHGVLRRASDAQPAGASYFFPAFRQPYCVAGCIGRIGEDDIIGFSFESEDKGQGRLAMNGREIARIEAGNVFLERA